MGEGSIAWAINSLLRKGYIRAEPTEAPQRIIEAGESKLPFGASGEVGFPPSPTRHAPSPPPSDLAQTDTPPGFVVYGP